MLFLLVLVPPAVLLVQHSSAPVPGTTPIVLASDGSTEAWTVEKAATIVETGRAGAARMLRVLREQVAWRDEPVDAAYEELARPKSADVYQSLARHRRHRGRRSSPVCPVCGVACTPAQKTAHGTGACEKKGATAPRPDECRLTSAAECQVLKNLALVAPDCLGKVKPVDFCTSKYVTCASVSGSSVVTGVNLENCGLWSRTASYLSFGV